MADRSRLVGRGPGAEWGMHETADLTRDGRTVTDDGRRSSTRRAATDSC